MFSLIKREVLFPHKLSHVTPLNLKNIFLIDKFSIISWINLRSMCIGVVNMIKHHFIKMIVLLVYTIKQLILNKK